MDGQPDRYLPGEILGRQRDGSSRRIRRWRQLPPAADSNAGTNPGAQRDSDAGAVTKCDTDTLGDSGVYTFADPVGDPKCNPDAGADPVAQRDGNPVGVGASRLADPHKGPGGRVTASPPVAAQAAGGTARPYGSCV